VGVAYERGTPVGGTGGGRPAGRRTGGEARRRSLRAPDMGSYLRLIDACITQLKAHGPSRTCNESKEGEGPDIRKSVNQLLLGNEN